MNYLKNKFKNDSNKKLTSRKIFILRIVLCTISLLLFIYNYINSFNMSNGEIIFTAIMILILSVFDVLIFVKNWLLCIIFSCIAYFNYSILMANYILKINYTIFTSMSEEYVSKIGINILLLFMLVINISLPSKVKNNKFKKNYLINKQNQNTVLVIGISLVLILILIYGFSRPDIVGERGTPSQIYEYSLIFFIVGFYFSGNKKFNIIILSIILVVFSLQNFFYGGRVTGLQLIICWFVMVYSYKVNLSKMIPLILVFFIVMSSIGLFRADFALSISSIEKVIQKIVNDRLTLDTAYSAYYTSLTFIKVEEFNNFSMRIDMFNKFILSMFVGGRMIPNSSLAEYTRQFYFHYYGGVLPFFFHYYLGWIGVLISGGITGLYCRFINRIENDTKGVGKCVSVFLVCHVFRWYLYSPSGLIRGVGLTIVVYYIAYIFDLIIKRKIIIS